MTYKINHADEEHHVLKPPVDVKGYFSEFSSLTTDINLSGQNIRLKYLCAKFVVEKNTSLCHDGFKRQIGFLSIQSTLPYLARLHRWQA